MALLKIKRIPLFIKRFSWEMDFHEMSLLPFLMIFTNIVYMTMSLGDLEIQIVSYAVLAGVMLSSILMATLCLRSKQITGYGFWYLLFFLLLLGPTLINMQDIKNCVYTIISILLNLLIFRYYRNHLKFIICCYAIALSFCVYANFIHLITHPTLWMVEDEKTNAGYLLGYNYNQMGCRLLIALIANALCIKFSKLWGINFIAIAITSIASLLCVHSMTALSMIVVFLFFCLIPSSQLRKLASISLFTIYVLFQTLVVFSGKGIESNEFSVYIIEDVLKKDITFTGRTYLWDSAVKTIAQSPIWGWGFVDIKWYKSFMSSQAAGPHNFILSVLINGGILLLSIGIGIAYKSYNSIKHYAKEKRCQQLIFATICLYFMALMEMYPYPIMLYPLIIMFYYPYLENKEL